MATAPVRVFISYSQKDRKYFDQLDKHLQPLRAEVLITTFHGGILEPADQYLKVLSEVLESADVILPLVSANYLASGFATNEIRRAVERWKEGSVQVIPIILSACAWHDTPLGEFQALPANGKPLNEFRDRAKAWTEVVEAIRERLVAVRSAAFLRELVTHSPDYDVNADDPGLRTEPGAQPSAPPPPSSPQSAAAPAGEEHDGSSDSYARTLTSLGAGTIFAPSYDSDESRGEDLLGFEKDARALASLIASTDTRPPLSIGLFGDWGSGKSFFMGQIRELVADIAQRARDAKANDATTTTAYHCNVVQIEFNAWHYIEGNLWASLVEHIFSNLRLKPGDEAEDADAELRRLDLLKLLEVEKEQQKKAEARRTEARAAAEKARQERTQKIEERVRMELVKTTEWEKALDAETLQSLGLTPDTFKAIGRLRDQGRLSWNLIGRLRATWRVVRERGKVATLLFALGVPFAIAGLGFLAEHVVETYLDAARIREVVTAVVTLASVIAWRIAPWLARAGHIAKFVEDKHRELELRRQKEAIAVDQEIEALTRRVEDADAQVSQASQRIEDIEKQIAATTSARIFSDFIEERAKSTDYRRHLGVLANIRRDFERMARFLERQKESSESRSIERIVLYIDDLDRCPAKRVVQVLEAIHLLLAFKLFVVVVGVDARWIARSLKLEYDALLGSADDGLDDSLGIEATPHDYLEKIFQVPFWIRPMSSTDCQNLIDGLTRPEPGGSGAPQQASATETGAPESTSGDQNIDREQLKSDSSATSTTIEPVSEPEPDDVDLNPVALQILQDEIDLMKRLTPLLGHSPRAVKRFINCYRLIKIGLDPAGVGAFLSEPKGALYYKPAMFLMALITGQPEFGEKVLDALEPEEVVALDPQGLLLLLGQTFGARFVEEREAVAKVLTSEAKLDGDAFRPEALRKAALVVRRYSFRAGYAAARRAVEQENRDRKAEPPLEEGGMPNELTA